MRCRGDGANSRGRRAPSAGRALLVVALVVGCGQLAAPSGLEPGRAAAATGVNKARPFSASSPWNTPTPASTQWFDAPVLHSLVASSSNGDSFRHWWVNTDSVGVWWSSPTDPLWTFDLPDYVAPSFHRNRPATTFTMRAPADLAAGTDVDHILVVIDPVSGDYVEVWQAEVDAATHTVRNLPGTPGWATGNAITGPGAGTLSQNDGVRASNFSWAGGLITGADLAAGAIDHALALAMPSEVLMGGGNTGHQGGVSTSTPLAWRAPATAWDAGFWGGPIEMGSRIGIPAGVARPSGLSRLGSMMFDALQTYGAFVGDYAGAQWPNFYADNRTVTTDQVCPLFCYWNYNGSSDMEKIAPLLRVADYQPVGPSHTVSIGSASIVEGDSGSTRSIMFPVTLSEPAAAGATVRYTVTADGSAIGSTRAGDGTDFRTKSGTVNFAAGSSTTTKYVNDVVYPDAAIEGNETFTVTLSDPTGGYALGTARATGTIVNDDVSSPLRVNVGDVSITEGDGGRFNTAEIPVNLSTPAPEPLEVTVWVGGGTAVAGVDYRRSFTKQVKFAKGARQAMVGVQVTPNLIPQGDRTVVLLLSNPSPASTLVIGRAIATVRIVDDD